VGLPTGPEDRFLGQSGVDGGVDLVGTLEAGALTLTADLGGHFRPAIDVENLDGADALRAALAAGVTPAEGLGFTLEWNVEAPLAANVEPGSATPSEVLLSGRKRFASGLHFGAGAAAGVMPGASAADYRAFVGLGYGRIAAPPPKDRDGDGITDDVDACLDDKETVNAWKDTDGCPDAMGTMEVEVVRNGLPVSGAPVTLTGPSGAEQFVTTDTLWSREVTPETDWKADATAAPCLAGTASVRATEGPTRIVVSLVPVLDARLRVEVVGPDGAFIPEAVVTWDTEPSGCVPAGRATLETGAGEQMVGAGTHRAFVTAPGWSTEIASITVAAKANETLRVQLKPTKVRVEARRIVILDKVFFETNKAVIKPESFELLNQVANTIVSNPQIGRVSVEGHTDTDGSDAKNLVLSKDRAAAVKAYLAERGVPVERLLSEGYGETRPIASNKSASGKAQNRRVEFNLPDQAPETEE
jgi:outer membrane protein OmpA-like peptidoglycan-associated protein